MNPETFEIYACTPLHTMIAGLLGKQNENYKNSLCMKLDFCGKAVQWPSSFFLFWSSQINTEQKSRKLYVLNQKSIATLSANSRAMQ